MTLPELLAQHPAFAPILPADVLAKPLVLDFTEKNRELDAVDLTDTQRFNDYVFGKLWAHDATVGAGGYDEYRAIYRRSAHFQQADEPRCIHLGIDLWARAGTPVFAPLAGQLHSVQDNAHFGDYGPTLILEHQLPVPDSSFTMRFYTLYGHLSRVSLVGKRVGMPVGVGEKIAEIGPFPENGDWPPHLHFQVIADLQGWRGDYPGVCALSERENYLRNCPNPNLLLRLS
ncbi:MAG: peptidoglycan DD-metalloendopeptidase family protein [Cytophagaceae bacterium]|nr:peptidoglycan DD-metalloendopeptidase family protein [Cytophagaceae bacterium]